MSDNRNDRTWPVLAAVWVSFLLYGAIAAPVPGVNEPHYLCKARHFWQPEWCAQDFFLQSPNVHAVFYATIGGLTEILTFEQSAWMGRILAGLVLAWGWTHCLSRMFFSRWGSLWSAWIFLVFTACGHFSGEWLVGGVEAKVPCYGFLLAAFGEVLRRRPLRAATWAGLAVSFHPVVGIWGLLAFAASLLIRCRTGARRVKPLNSRASTLHAARSEAQSNAVATDPVARQRPLNRIILPCLMLVVLALPGLIPVFQLLADPVTNETRFAATYLQVYFRLAHHLDPMLFPARAYLGYAVLLIVWLSSLTWGGRTNSKMMLDQIVVWAVVFAVVGFLVGWGPRPPKLMPYFAERMHLLKYYPFRLADVLLPIAVAASLVGLLERTLLFLPPSRTWRSLVWHPTTCLFLLFLAGLCRAHTTSETNRYSSADRADWLDVCAWIDEHLPLEAVVQPPTNGWAFKWFAQRAEYVAFKDCPQDATGIVEWNRRLNFLQQWFERHYADEFYSASEMHDLHRQTGLTHLLTDRLGPMELEPIYRNGAFQVYDLRNSDR